MDIVDVLWAIPEQLSTADMVQKYAESVLESTDNNIDEELWKRVVDAINEDFSNRGNSSKTRANRYIKTCMKSIMDIPESSPIVNYYKEDEEAEEVATIVNDNTPEVIVNTTTEVTAAPVRRRRRI